jgi:simple sugar transport system permease protein
MLYPSIGSGLGFLGLLTALVGGQRTAGILLASLLFGAMLNGADGMQTESGVPATLATLLQGLALLWVGLVIGGRATPSNRS